MDKHFVNLTSNPDADDFSLLQDITSILSSSFNLQDTMQQIFSLFETRIQVTSAILSLLDPYTHAFYTEMEYGIKPSQKESDDLKLRLQLSQSVSENNSPILIPIVEEDPIYAPKLALFCTPSRPTSFICLPITLDTEKIGSLNIICPFESVSRFNQIIKTLSFFTLIIGQEIKLIRLKTREQSALQSENIQLKDELKEKYTLHNMVGNSNEMKAVYDNIRQVANTTASVLIRGESGTGKELVAHAIHYNSDRANEAFIRINCGAIPENLIESELFGYEKGAFTDATEQKIGKFEAADKGSIFLDEIGELSPLLQVKLLRVLQEQEFNRVGGVTPVKINVRLIAATNKNIETEIAEGQFRQDLFYRLNVFPIFLPSLRDRKTDILLLANHFLDSFAEKNHKTIHRISSMANNLLMDYTWPGNVRELENCIERAILLCNGGAILAEHLPPTLQKGDPQEHPEEHMSLKEMTQMFERNIIREALNKFKGNQSKTARHLKTSNRILGYKIQQLGIDLRKKESFDL